MKTKIFILFLSLSICSLAQNTKPNILRSIYADTTIYQYGQVVHIRLVAINTASTQDTIILSGCNEAYPFIDNNDYTITFAIGCFPETASVHIIPAKDSVEWKFDYPHKDKPEIKLAMGQHTAFGYFQNRLPNTDTISFTVKRAPNEVGRKNPNPIFLLEQNYPNPFNPSTIIAFQLEKESFVSLKIFDLMGREVQSLVQSKMSSGSHSIEWIPETISSGVYYYRIVADSRTETRKLIFNK